MNPALHRILAGSGLLLEDVDRVIEAHYQVQPLADRGGATQPLIRLTIAHGCTDSLSASRTRGAFEQSRRRAAAVVAERAK